MFNRGIVITVVAVFMAMVGGSMGWAQAVGEGASQKVRDKLTLAESRMKKVESLVDKLDALTVYGEQDSGAMDSAMQEHAGALRDAAVEAIQEVEQSAKAAQAAPQGKTVEIDVRSAQSLEKLAKNHEARAQKIMRKIAMFQAKLQQGDVELDKSVLEKLSDRIGRSSLNS